METKYLSRDFHITPVLLCAHILCHSIKIHSSL